MTAPVSRSQPSMETALRNLHADLLGQAYDRSTLLDASNEIESLKARIQDLEEALRELMDQPTENPLRLSPPQLEALWAAHNRARSALQPKDAE